MTTENKNRPIQSTCRVVRAEREFEGKQAFLYAPGISAKSVGAQNIHLQIVTIPPGAKAKAHMHTDHESAIYILIGKSGMWYGQGLTEHLVAEAGDFVISPPPCRICPII